MRSPRVEPSHTIEALEARMHLTASPSVPTARSVADGGPGLVHTLAHLAHPTLDIASVIVGDKAVFAGSNSTPDNEADVYDNATGAWTSATLSVARWQFGATVAGEKAIFAGGATGDNIGNAFGATNAVDIYNSASARWSTAKLSLGRWSIAAAATGNTAIFAGGFTTPNVMSDRIDLYDADTGRWSTAKLSQLRNGMAAASIGNLALFAGGYTPSVNGKSIESDVVDIYDDNTGRWSKAKLSQARAAISVAVVNNKVIFAGGSANGTPSDVVDIYDSETGRWSTTQLSTARYFIATVVLDGRAIFAGGGTTSNQSSVPTNSDAVDIYNSVSDRWSTTKLSHAGSQFAAGVTGDKALFAGAHLQADNEASDAVDVFDAQTDRWSTTKLSQGRRLIGTASIGGKVLFAAGDPEDIQRATDLIDIFTSDDTPPTARLVSVPTLRNSARFYTFTVSYHDNIRIDAKRLDGGDIVVTGPNGFEQHAELISQSRGGRGSNRVAVYAIRGPDGRWDTSDNGVYTLHLQGGEVKDLAGNYAISDRIGRFTLTIPTSPQSSSLPTVPTVAIPFQSKRKIDYLLET